MITVVSEYTQNSDIIDIYFDLLRSEPGVQRDLNGMDVRKGGDKIHEILPGGLIMQGISAVYKKELADHFSS